MGETGGGEIGLGANYRARLKSLVARLHVSYRQAQAEVVSNSGNKITKPGESLLAEPCRARVSELKTESWSRGKLLRLDKEFATISLKRQNSFTEDRLRKSYRNRGKVTN